MLTLYLELPLCPVWFIGFPIHSCPTSIHLLHNNQIYFEKQKHPLLHHPEPCSHLWFLLECKLELFKIQQNTVFNYEKTKIGSIDFWLFPGVIFVNFSTTLSLLIFKMGMFIVKLYFSESAWEDKTSLLQKQWECCFNCNKHQRSMTSPSKCCIIQSLPFFPVSSPLSLLFIEFQPHYLLFSSLLIYSTMLMSQFCPHFPATKSQFK